MRSADLIRLLSLAAIWGASFLFMRILAPTLGAIWTTELRAAIAGLAMLAWISFHAQNLHLRAHWKIYLVLGFFSSALPGALFVYAALTLPSGYSAILNATSPLWGALIGAAVLGERLTVRKVAGMLIGIAGVALLVRLGPVQFNRDVLAAALACAVAALCYGIATTYTKKISAGVAAPMLATGSQLGAAALLLPLLPFAHAPGPVTSSIVLVMLALGLLCSGVAYFVYFRLIVDIGPAKALTVTFLIPLFALAWGKLLLDEAINLTTLIGCALVIVATWLVAFQKAAAESGAGPAPARP